MLRSAFLRVAILAGLILGGCAAPVASTSPRYSAFIQADCAPWDGAAFTLSIPFDTGRLVRVSIYQSADVPRRSTFTFPDSTGRVGNASYLPELGPELALSGNVTFLSVQTGAPVEGEFDLRSSAGMRLRGQFNATWVSTQALCG